MSYVVYKIKRTIEVTLEVSVDDQHSQSMYHHNYENPKTQEYKEAEVWAESIIGAIDESRSGYGSVDAVFSRVVPGTTTIEVMNR